MSKELNSISGKTEFIKDYHSKEVDYKHNQIHLTAFFGGEERGRCVQLTIDENHVQLTLESAQKLRNELIRFCDGNY